MNDYINNIDLYLNHLNKKNKTNYEISKDFLYFKKLIECICDNQDTNNIKPTTSQFKEIFNIINEKKQFQYGEYLIIKKFSEYISSNFINEIEKQESFILNLLDDLMNKSKQNRSNYISICEFIKSNYNLISFELSIEILNRIIKFINLNYYGSGDGNYNKNNIVSGGGIPLSLFYPLLSFKDKIGLNGYINNGFINQILNFIKDLSIPSKQQVTINQIDQIEKELFLIDLINGNQNQLVYLLFFCQSNNQLIVYQLISNDTNLNLHCKGTCNKSIKSTKDSILKKEFNKLIKPFIKIGLFERSILYWNLTKFKSIQNKELCKLGINKYIKVYKKIWNSITFNISLYIDPNYQLLLMDESLLSIDEKKDLSDLYNSTIEKLNKSLTTTTTTTLTKSSSIIQLIFNSINNNEIKRISILKYLNQFIILSNNFTISNFIYKNFKNECNQLIKSGNDNNMLVCKLLKSLQNNEDQLKAPNYLYHYILKLYYQEYNSSCLNINEIIEMSLISKSIYSFISNEIIPNIPITSDQYVKFNKSTLFDLNKLKHLQITITSVNSFEFNNNYNYNSIETLELIGEVTKEILGQLNSNFKNLKKLILSGNKNSYQLLPSNIFQDIINQNNGGGSGGGDITIEINFNLCNRSYFNQFIYHFRGDGNFKDSDHNEEHELEEIQNAITKEESTEYIINYKLLNTNNANDWCLITKLQIDITSLFRNLNSITNFTNLKYLSILVIKYFNYKKLVDRFKLELILKESWYSNLKEFEIILIYPRSIERILNIFEKIFKSNTNKLSTIKFNIKFTRNDYNYHPIESSKQIDSLYTTIFALISTNSIYSNIKTILISNENNKPLLASWNNINLYSFIPSDSFDFIKFNRVGNSISTQSLPNLLYGNDIKEGNTLNEDDD